MGDEDRLRELLHDPGWSLPGWPRDQALARIRRAARRQRLTIACESIAIALIASATVLSAVTAATHGVLRPWTRKPLVAVSRFNPSHGLPPVGSSGFPAAIYPAAVKRHADLGAAMPCPASSGLRAPRPATRAEALSVLRSMRAGLTHELRVTDRTIWLTLADRRRATALRILRAAPSSVRYSGPLRAGVGELAAVRDAVAADCGDPVMRSTWVIVSGVPGSRSQDAELLFLTRRGHVLLYNVQ